ncbi:MAG: hypothetical protein EA393_00725 [Bacteroidetes bacterium]|nr:MAG: hypothetical protein EA393_00725 [Bacteroidota bacterium]
MVLPESLEKVLLSVIEKNIGEKVDIERSSSLSGGSINSAFRIKTMRGNFFAKYNSASQYPDMFKKEAQGLEILYNAGEVYTPKVIGYGETDNMSLLVLEYVDAGMEIRSFWEDFGTKLARLHKHTNDYFGLDHDNYIGSLKQFNDAHDNWIDFFVTQRLEVQIKLARDKGLMDSSIVTKFARLGKCLSDFFPVEKPSLLHGDLWSGNYMTNSMGEACIIDPAVYYGHRLMDIGMSKLFGGFSTSFYDAYNKEYPMENNWQEAVEVANLYPLMVHVNLFGAGYLGSVNQVLKKF